MRSRTSLLPLLLAGGLLRAQAPPPAPAPEVPATQASPAAARPMVAEDLLSAPKELQDLVFKVGARYNTNTGRARELSRLIFASPKEGGLGIVYDNTRTRTVAEVVQDRKANCLSLTALYVASCKMLGINATFADAPSISLWVRRGPIVYNERHMVAAIRLDVVNAVIADFGGLPTYGVLRVRPLPLARFKALFHSNRAVEELQAGNLPGALANARASIEDDSDSGIGWNILGVVQRRQGDDKGAEASFLRALAVDEANGAACGNLEDLYAQTGRPQKASAYRELGLRLRERDPYFHAFLAREALAQGRNDDARAEIRKAIGIQHMEPEFYLVLAQVEVNEGERKAATRAVEKAIQWSLPEQRKRMESKLAMLQDQPA
ncbi:MAG TPA: tetratricopeptide repeat protein [Holophagaceae bacterium]|nr:tetratricopeptide repeat protein [Holophagaceae bacterium]